MCPACTVRRLIVPCAKQSFAEDDCHMKCLRRACAPVRSRPSRWDASAPAAIREPSFALLRDCFRAGGARRRATSEAAGGACDAPSAAAAVLMVRSRLLQRRSRALDGVVRCICANAVHLMDSSWELIHAPSLYGLKVAFEYNELRAVCAKAHASCCMAPASSHWPPLPANHT